MRTLNVELAERSYPIQIGANLLGQPGLLKPYVKTRRVAVVTNDVVGPLYLDAFVAGLEAEGLTVTRIVLPDGEAHKDWPTLNLIFDGLLAARCDRGTTLIALGGGVVGDVVGFAAATYQRGVPFIQVPTTLLSQVDSSVGGKTAINHPLGKNMIGAFYQPKLVLADTDYLASLPPRELSAGLAEVIKYGLIRDLPFLEWIETHLDGLLAKDPALLEHAIYQSCVNKAEIVGADEKEQGVRALLNLGHTFGHAIETGVGYGKWLHGEAVAAGTVMALELSRRLGWISHIDVKRATDLFQRAGLPTRGPDLGDARYLELMQHDKKVVDARLRLVLLKEIGKAILVDDVPLADVSGAIAACVEHG